MARENETEFGGVYEGHQPSRDKTLVLSAWMPEQDRVRLAVLGKLLEELGELTAIAARCVIQGIDEREPVTGKLNRTELTNEIADVRAAVLVLGERLSLDHGAMRERELWKAEHLRRWHSLVERTDIAV